MLPRIKTRAVVLKQALYIFYTEFNFTASYFLRRNEEKSLISRVVNLRSFEEAYEPCNRSLFYNPTPQEHQKISEISMEGENIWISLSLFRSGPSTKNLYKINESNYQCLEENNDKIDNLLPHTNHGRDHGRDNFPQRLIFLLENLGFVINWEKFILTPIREIDFLGVANSQSMTMTVPWEKLDKLISLCQTVLNTRSLFRIFQALLAN